MDLVAAPALIAASLELDLELLNAIPEMDEPQSVALPLDAMMS